MMAEILEMLKFNDFILILILIILINIIIIGPFKMLLFNFAASFFIYLYKSFIRYKSNHDTNIWYKPVYYITKIVDIYGRVFHDYEIDLSKIPDKGPAILILYHGITPCDLSLIFSRVFLEKKRKITVIVDRMAFKIPGVQSFIEALELTTGSHELCLSILNKGGMIAIYPGGTRESIFSGKNYNLIWGNRKGFAKIAIDSKTPIIPMFTKNCRELHCQLKLGENLFRKIYEKYKIPIFFIYGWFPVKLKTYIGEPIHYKDQISAEELAQITKLSIENLIEKYQKRPGRTLDAIKERFNLKKID